MSHNSDEVAGQGLDADSSAAQPSAPPASSEPAPTSSPEEPDKEIHENDQVETPEELLEDEGGETHGTTDAGISTANGEEGRSAFDRVSQFLLQGEDADQEVLDTIAEIGKNWPELLNRAINDEGDTVLHTAVNEDLAKAFYALLEARKSLSKVINSRWKQIPLHTACFQGRLDFVKKLVRLGSDINAQDTVSMTPLHHACYYGRLEIVEFLLDSNVNITLADNDGWPPFTTAVIRGHRNIAERLLEEGADIDYADNNGLTPLHHAACSSDLLELVSFLIRKNADVNSRDECGSTPLDLACWNGSEEVVRLLTGEFKDRETLESRDNNDWTPLITASRAGFPKVVRLLLDAGATRTSCTTEDTRRWTALMTACRRGHEEVARMLLDPPDQADELLSQKDRDGETPLHYASRYGQRHMVNILLESNADHSKPDADGRTPLHRACLGEFDESNEEESQTDNCETASQSSTTGETEDPYFHVTESLLKKGADPSAKTKEDDTALHIVAGKRSPTWIAKIMENVEPEGWSQKNKAKKTPLHIAVDREDSSAIVELLKRLKSPENDFENREKEAYTLAFTKLDSEEIRKTLLDLFRAIRPLEAKSSREDWSALEWAAVEGHPRVLWEVLIKSPRTSQTNEGIKRALKELEDKKKQEDGQKTDPSRNMGKGDEGDKKTSKRGKKNAESKVAADGKANQKPYTEKHTKGRDGKGGDAKESDRQLIKEILMNPPITTTSMPWEKLRPPVKPTDPRVPRDMEAVLLEFFVNSKASGFLRRTERVEEVIYTKGPQKIMNELKERLRGIKGRSKLPVGDFQEELLGKLPEPKFTWIHLPANNIKWMNDLTRRVWSDMKAKTEDAKATIDDPGSSEKGVEGAKDETAQTTGDRSEPKVEGGKYVESRGTQTKGGQQNRHHDGGDSVDTRDLMEVKFNTAKWFFQTSWRQLPENPSEKRFMRPTCKLLRDSAGSPDHPGNLVALYMPYLRFSTEIEPARTGAEDKAGGNETDPQEKFRQARSRHNDFIRSRCKDIVHGSRTLDEFYYQHLVTSGERLEVVDESRQEKQERFAHDMVERNHSQVASRYFHGEGLEKREQWDILRVDQLWMWIIDEKTIVTSSTHPFDGTRDPVIDSVLGFLSKRTEDPRLHTQASETDIQKLSRVIVQVCCDFYDEAWRDSVERGESVRHVFSNTINDIAIREADLFQNYRKRQSEDIHDRDEINAADDPRVTDRDKAAKREREAKCRQKRQNDMKNDISRTSKLFYEIRDTSDELKILLTLATHQKEVQAKLCGGAWSDDCKAGNIVNDLAEKISLANKIRQAVETTLTLQQSELSILQNELSIEQTSAAQKQATATYEQGRTLMTFTIITILFLPASFFSSLFALDVASFLDSPPWAFVVLGMAFLLMAAFSAWLYMRTPARRLGERAKGRLLSEGEFPRRLIRMLLPEGQENERSSKGGAAENKAGGDSGAGAQSPGDDHRQVAKGDAEASKGRTPVLTTAISMNEANGHPVQGGEPRQRSWIKKLLRGGQASDRGSEDDKV